MNTKKKAPNIHEAKGSISVSSELKDSGEVKSKKDETKREVESVIKDPHAAYVRVDGGITKNLGDYNSVKIGVSISMPCEPTFKAINKCYKKTSKLVDELMDKEYSSVVED